MLRCVVCGGVWRGVVCVWCVWGVGCVCVCVVRVCVCGGGVVVCVVVVVVVGRLSWHKTKPLSRGPPDRVWDLLVLHARLLPS